MVEEALDQLKAAQQDVYVQSTQNVIDELEVALHQPLIVRSALSKYSPEFERDFKWYLSMRSKFSFDGAFDYTNKKGQPIVVNDKNGVSGKEAFYKWDSNGKILPTKHPNLLQTLLKTKGSVNLHIKMYAEDRAKGLLPLIEFRVFCIKYRCPAWFKEAVERQKVKYYGDVLS